jgi:hypothetical protein
MLIDYERKEGKKHTRLKAGGEAALILLVLIVAVLWLAGHPDLAKAILQSIHGLGSS